MDLRRATFFTCLISVAFCAVKKENLFDLTNETIAVKEPVLEITQVPVLSSTPVSDANTTTTSTPTTSTTTTSTTTTSTTTTTEPSKTTTTTTTPPPSTTTTEPPTTTIPYTTTVNSQTTTTAKPTPAPSTNTTTPGEWLVKDGNVTCIVTKMVVSVNVSYTAKDNTTKNIVLVPVVNNVNGTVVRGTCGNVTQSISVPLINDTSLTMNFGLNNSKTSVLSMVVNITGLADVGTNTSKVFFEKTPVFTTPVKMSYKCNKEQTINLTNAENKTAILNISDVQIQAFRQDGNASFGDAEDCEGTETPDLVPIAVGVSLGVMILVVLVAYLIGRRRSQASGYVSM